MHQKEPLKSSNNSRIIIIILLLLLLSGAIFFKVKIDKLTIPQVSEKQEDILKQWDHKADELIITLQDEQKRILEELNQIPEKSDNWELKNYMLRSVNEKIAALNEIKQDIAFYRDTLDFHRIDKRMKLAVAEARSSVGVNKLSSDIIKKINKMDKIQVKIDSLDLYIAEAQAASSLKGRELQWALNQRNAYKDSLFILQHISINLERERDSFKLALALANSTLDSLTGIYSTLNDDFEKLKVEAARNAELATYMQTWYYEKDKMRRPVRRALVEDKEDFNNGNDIRTVHGMFNIGADKFVPFKVANITLFQLESNKKSKITEAKMTVRDQTSGEFSLITEPGLDRGEYLIEVEYNGQIILENKFYVSR